MAHFHYCEVCKEDSIYCDIPHCEYQDVLQEIVRNQHYLEEHNIYIK